MNIIVVEQHILVTLDQLRSMIREQGIEVAKDARMTIRESKTEGQKVDICWPAPPPTKGDGK